MSGFTTMLLEFLILTAVSDILCVSVAVSGNSLSCSPSLAFVKYDCWDDALLVEDHINVGSLVMCILFVLRALVSLSITAV